MIVLGLAIGGGLGALARFQIEGIIAPRRSDPFKISTPIVNVSGSFLFGGLAGLTIAGYLPSTWLTWAGAGFLGAFTTFSTFTYETAQLIEDRRWRDATWSLFLSGPLCFGAAAIGYLVGR